MIKLNRPQRPDLFNSSRIVNETERIKAAYSSLSQERLKFNMTLLMPVREYLVNAANGKCAYCESRIGISASADVDHFRPKGGSTGFNNEYSSDHYFWLAYDWENLVPSCQICSRSKRNSFPIKEGHKRVALLATGTELELEQRLLIDPFKDDPKKAFKFLHDGTVSALNEQGAATIKVLALNRPPLIVARRAAGEKFLGDLARYTGEIPREERNQLSVKIDNIFSEHSREEYSALLRSIFNKWYESNKYPGAISRQLDLLTFGLPSKEQDSNFGSKEKPSLLKKISAIFLPTPVLKPEQEIGIGSRFTIKTVELANFKAIDYLKIEVLPSDSLSEKESWLLVLGDNGVGKSSILQAIALTLGGTECLKSLKISPQDIYKRGAINEGYVKIFTCEREEPYELRFNHEKFIKKPEEVAVTLLAYGATRLLPKGQLKSEKRKPAKVNIANLFDYSVALVNAGQWLLDQSEDDFNNRIAPVLIDLLYLNGGVKISRVQEEVFVGEIELRKISDGYRSMIAMACDIMRTLSLHKTRFHETQGVVIIDELGNHLHPRWRMKIVNALREAFPKLQFIVSTHEPLCLRGLLHGEVVVLVSDKDKQIIALDSQVLPDHNLLRIDQLLTSDLFGLIDTADQDTQEKFDKYYKLLLIPEEARTDDDKAEIARYTAELSEKDLIGDTPRSQAIYQLINESFAKSLIEVGFKTNTQLKADTIEDVKEIIKNNKNFDWL